MSEFFCTSQIPSVPNPDKLAADEPLFHRAYHHPHRQRHTHHQRLLQVILHHHHHYHHHHHQRLQLHDQLMVLVLVLELCLGA